jgi:hypothetical protein
MKVYGVALLFYSSSTMTYVFEEMKYKRLTSQAIIKIYASKDKAERVVADLNEKYKGSEEKRLYVKSYMQDSKGPVYGSPAVFPPLGDFYVQEIEVSE